MFEKYMDETAQNGDERIVFERTSTTGDMEVPKLVQGFVGYEQKPPLNFIEDKATQKILRLCNLVETNKYTVPEIMDHIRFPNEQITAFLNNTNLGYLPIDVAKIEVLVRALH